MNGLSYIPVRSWGRLGRVLSLSAVAVSLLLSVAAARAGSCRLQSARGDIRHVIYVQFDNTHFLRDNPNVPSDLEQMPNLLNFIENNGTLLTNDHTVLISHTAGGILSSLTGVYPDRHGQTVSNSYVRTSNAGRFSFLSSFGYWTDADSAAGTPTVPNIVGPDGRNIPAPWVAFTRAGCDVGGVASANIVLENTRADPDGDITKVFGNPSPEATEAQASAAAPFGSAARAKAQTDFVGFAIHCARDSAVCVAGHPDLLPDEPGGYVGFKGLFGAQEINPLLVGGPTVTDLLGHPITDPFGQPGFPGFDGMSAAVSLTYVAAMQERGIPVTYAYISDAHDFHGVSGNAHIAFGPGSQGYVRQLKAYDDAFGAFFARLAADGIDRDNTLFVFTVDEGDHFVGVPQPGCDGVTVPCVYGENQIGEIDANIDTLVGEQFPSLAARFLGAGAPDAFTVHGDDAPPFYLANKGGGALSQTDPLTRTFERDVAALTAVNPYTGATDRLLVRMADRTGMKALHMITAGDPARNATFVLFADPDYFITDFPSSTCKTCIGPAFAWNHGDIQPEIARTWLGFVGPGVRRLGTSDIWTDHTDVRPTMLALLGLHDPYVHDGRTVLEPLHAWALPPSLRVHRGTLIALGALYKQVNGAFGQFALHTLTVSTRALESGSADNDARYARLEAEIRRLTDRRDALATRMKRVLDAAAFDGRPIGERAARRLIVEGVQLLASARHLARR